jgi:cytochrome c
MTRTGNTRPLLSRTILLGAALLFLSTGCGDGATSPATSDAPAAAETEPQASAPADAGNLATASIAASVANAGEDVLRRGKILFLQCRSCHSLEAGGDHKVGPNLHGLFGAAAASKEGFGYSEALQQAGIVWDADTLNTFVQNPNGLVSGTAMAFAGLPAEEDRIAVISYLADQTR